MRKLTEKEISNFKSYLIDDEKSKTTISKYLYDISVFVSYIGGKSFEKPDVIEYKSKLEEEYSPSSVNSMISSVNALFSFLGWYEMRVKALKIQKQVFESKEKELTKAEYNRLLDAALEQDNERLYFLTQTIASTGIRVSEVEFITVEALRRKHADVHNKGKRRKVLLPDELCEVLLDYCKKQNITSGYVFRTKNGKPVDRSNIWKDMKKLCRTAHVSEKKVFPHNFRHLFARTYYSLQKDIVRLADILGHSSINTTRIYTAESGEVHRRQIQKLEFVRCRC